MTETDSFDYNKDDLKKSLAYGLIIDRHIDKNQSFYVCAICGENRFCYDLSDAVSHIFQIHPRVLNEITNQIMEVRKYRKKGQDLK